MCQVISCRIVVIMYILTLIGVVGCAATGPSSGRGDDDFSQQRYGWWTGSRGKSVGVDIDTSGNGLQIEVVRGYLAYSKIDSPVGVRWTHNYLMHLRNAPNKRIKLFRANGDTVLFIETEPGTLISEDDETLVLMQTTNGHRLQDDTGTEFGFNRKGRLTHIHGHEYGNILSLAYGADGYLESISHSKGQVITFFYDPETHRLASVGDGRGRQATYQHDDLGNLTSVTNMHGITSDYSYDRQSRLVGVTFP